MSGADEPAWAPPSLLRLVPDRQQLERERLARAAARERARNPKKRTRSVSPDAPSKAPSRAPPPPASSRYTPPEPQERFWTGTIKVRIFGLPAGHIQPLCARHTRRNQAGAAARSDDAGRPTRSTARAPRLFRR